MFVPTIGKGIYLNSSYEINKDDTDTTMSSYSHNLSNETYKNISSNRYRLNRKDPTESIATYFNDDYVSRKKPSTVYKSPMRKNSKYKWENESKNQFPPLATEHRHSPQIPFQSILSKGWFSRPPCDCNLTSLLNLQSCCFISESYLPSNTLSLDYVTKKALPNPLISVSKHKMIRKREASVQKRQTVSTFALCTQRKLIRRQRDDDKNVSKRKRLGSQFALLTERKLVRKPGEQLEASENQTERTKRESKATSTVQLRKSPAKKSNSIKSPGKLIRVGRNKLFRSSLLPNTTTGVNSMLSHIIRYRRVPYSHSYILLTRNKLIRKLNENQVRPKVDGVRKRRTSIRKTFVSLGKTKLMRKSLFKKTNKATVAENLLEGRNARKEFISHRFRSCTLHYRSAQRFTNHWSRRNLKFLSLHSSLISPYRFGNKCKNNKRILRKRKSNMVCPTFRKTGECLKRKERRECALVHDKKYVSICQNLIRGVCNNIECKLSHDLIPEKMPTCLHFLKEDCQHENCIYTHAKPANSEAPICSKFLRGYCPNGDRCIEWHVYACPTYKKDFKCPKNDKCRLPHRDAAFFDGKSKDDGNDLMDDDGNWRYFGTNQIQTKENDGLVIIPNRDNLGKMGDYVPL